MKIIIIIIFILMPLTAFSQNEQEIITYAPQATEEDNLEAKIEERKVLIKNSGYLDVLKPYIALRKEDLSFCDSETCKEKAKGLFLVRYLGEGRCNEIQDSGSREICNALKSNNCESLAGWSRNCCKALLTDNIDLFIANNIAYQGKDERAYTDKIDTLMEFGCYSGFKYYNAMACEKYLKAKDIPLSSLLSCRIITAQDADAAIEAISKDIALFELSKEESESSLCGFINDATIKGACLDSRIKDIRRWLADNGFF